MAPKFHRFGSQIRPGSRKRFPGCWVISKTSRSDFRRRRGIYLFFFAHRSKYQRSAPFAGAFWPPSSAVEVRRPNRRESSRWKKKKICYHIVTISNVRGIGTYGVHAREIATAERRPARGKNSYPHLVGGFEKSGQHHSLF